VGKTDSSVAFLIFLQHSGNHRSKLASFIAQNDLGSNASTLAGTYHQPPIICGFFLEQQHFEFSPGMGIASTQSGGDYSRIVHDQNVATIQITNEVLKPTMLDLSRRAMQH